MALTKEQSLHLSQRINDRNAELRYRKRDPKPASVAKAEAVVHAWEKAQHEKSEEHTRKVKVHTTAAREAVLSGNWPDALAAVKKFETTKF